VAESIGGPAGYRLLESARESFDSGVVLTSGIGVGLMALAIVLALVSLRRVRSEG
jgi:DHA2 family multidrug resistance protein-like MFS transporter